MRVNLKPRHLTAALTLSGIDLSTTGDVAYFEVPFKCQAVYAGLTVTVVMGGAAVVKFDRRNLAGSATGRTDGTIATITIPNSTAAGKMVYDKACQTSLTEAAAALLVTAATCRAGGGYWNGTTCENHPYGELQPGNQVVVEIISGTSGNAQPILVVDIDEEQFANLQNCLLTA